MERFDLAFFPDHCTGCLRCALACSELFTGRFSLGDARVRVDLDLDRCTLAFTETCTRCGVCAENCLYGALVKVSRGDQP